jgi:LacI family transcriptional regulator
MGQDLATMKSVAEKAGVSQSTVSRILAGQRQYATKTVDRVLAAAEHLKYRPNSLVRGILTGRTRCVGVMVPASSRFYGPMVEGIHDAMCEADHVMSITWSKRSLPVADDTTELALIHRLVEQRVDGIILRPTCDEATQAYFEEIWQRRLPRVAVDRDLPGARADFVGTDDDAGAAAAAGHLLGLGHRHLAVGHRTAVRQHRPRPPDGLRGGRDRRRRHVPDVGRRPARAEGV